MLWNALNGSEKVWDKLSEMARQWLDQRAIPGAVECIEMGNRIVDGVFEQYSGAVIEWMGARSSRFRSCR
jgi:hypothetical protein